MWGLLRRSECGEANGVMAHYDNALRVEFAQREDRAFHFEHFAEPEYDAKSLEGAPKCLPC